MPAAQWSSLHAAWESLAARSGLSWDEFRQLVDGWEVHPVTLAGEAVGAVLVNGPEIHACIKEGYGRWFRKEQIGVLNEVIRRHGYAQTSATTPAGLEFVRRLGFEQHGSVFRRYAPWELKQH